MFSPAHIILLLFSPASTFNQPNSILPSVEVQLADGAQLSAAKLLLVNQCVLPHLLPTAQLDYADFWAAVLFKPASANRPFSAKSTSGFLSFSAKLVAGDLPSCAKSGFLTTILC